MTACSDALRSSRDQILEPPGNYYFPLLGLLPKPDPLNPQALLGNLPVVTLRGFAGDDSTQDVKIGLSKILVQGPLIFRLNKLLSKLSRAMGDDVPLNIATERLALCSEVLAGMCDLNEDFWALAGEVIKAGVGLLGREECGVDARKAIRGYLAGVVVS